MRLANLRFCFTRGLLTTVIVLNQDGSCDTPSCDWTTTQVPVDLTKIHAGMTLEAYLELCRES